MTQSLSISKDSFKSLCDSTKEQEFSYGLLIGQKWTDSREQILLHWCPTVALEGEEAYKSVSDLQADAIAIHASQVVRMLPGGVHILGIYISYENAPNKMSDTSCSSKIRSILSLVHHDAVIPFTTKLGVEVPDYTSKLVALTVCNKSSKNSVHSFSVVSQGGLPEPASLKIEANIPVLKKFEFSYDMDLTLYREKKDIKDSSQLHSLLISQLKNWASSVSQSMVIAEGGCVMKQGNKTSIGDQFPSEGVIKCFVVTPTINQNTSGDYVYSQSASSFSIKGTMTGSAFLNNKSTVSDALQAIHTDIFRSLCARWTLHCDSLMEESSVAPEHELPRRVVVSDTSVPFSFYDYLFPGDSAADVIQSIQELLNVSVTENNINTTAESAPKSSTASGDRNKSSSKKSSVETKQPTNMFMAVAVLLLAVLVPFWLFGMGKSD